MGANLFVVFQARRGVLSRRKRAPVTHLQHPELTMPAEPTDNNSPDRLSPALAFFSQLHSTAQSAGLHPLYPAVGPARARSADTHHKERLRGPSQSTSNQDNKKPVFVDVTQDDDSAKKPRNLKRKKTTTAGVIDLTLSSDDDKVGAESDSSSIVIISSTMSSGQARKESQRKREIEEDKRKGLSQARLSSLFARPRGENVSRPPSGSSPTNNPNLSPLSSSSSQTLCESQTITSSTPQGTSQPATTASAIQGSKGKGKERAEPCPVTMVSGPSKYSPSIFKTAADTEIYPSAPATIPSSTPLKAPLLNPSQSRSSELASSPSPSDTSTPVPMDARYPTRRTAALSSSPASVSSETAISTPIGKPVKAPVIFPKLSSKNHIDEIETSPLKIKQMTASSAASITSASTSSRSSRARPLPGAYTLPTIDTPIHEWPTFQGTSAPVKKGKKNVHEEPGVNKTFRREVSVEIPKLAKRELAKETESPSGYLGQGSSKDPSPTKKLGNSSLSLLNQTTKQCQVSKTSPTKQPPSMGKVKQKHSIRSSKNIATVLDLKSLSPEPCCPSEITSKSIMESKIVTSSKEQSLLVPDAASNGSFTSPPKETDFIPPSSPLTELSDSDDDNKSEITEKDEGGGGEKRGLSSSTMNELIASPLPAAKDAHLPPHSLLEQDMDVEIPSTNALKMEAKQEFQEQPKEGVKDDELDELDVSISFHFFWVLTRRQLDEWDNFEWTVSTSPIKDDTENPPPASDMSSSYMGPSATPSKRSLSKPPSSTLTPSRLAQSLVSPSKRPTPQTPHNVQKRATPVESSPTTSAKKRKLQVDKYAKMLAETNSLEQAEKEEQKRKEEEEKRKIDELLGAADDVEEEGHGNVAEMLQ